MKPTLQGTGLWILRASLPSSGMGSPEVWTRESLRPWCSKEELSLNHRVMMMPGEGVGEARETVDKAKEKHRVIEDA